MMAAKICGPGSTFTSTRIVRTYMMSDQHDDADDADDVKPAAPVLSYQTPSQAIDWVSVWTAQNTLEANLAVATLQARGIHARLDMENSAGLGLPYAGVIYAKVQVLAQDA